MSLQENDPLDHAIDDVLASMVAGEPRRVSGASVRRAVERTRPSAFPIGLATAAVLVILLGVFLRRDTLAPAQHSASSAPIPTPIPRLEASPAPSPDLTSGIPTTSKRPRLAMTSEPVYEGLPRLETASIVLPEPLETGRLGADPIQIPGLLITPLSVSGLSNEQENK